MIDPKIVLLSAVFARILSNILFKNGFYLRGIRIHHYHLGLLLTLLALKISSPKVLSLGLGLLIDDSKDFGLDLVNLHRKVREKQLMKSGF